ncbi:MAG: helix-turn-helix domain-containing protein, partial [Pseudomonadota bacterium]
MQSVRAVDRAIDILQAVSGQPDGVKIAELEKQTGIARPTLYRLVRTLESRQLLRQCSDPTQYALDIGVVALAQPMMRSVDLLSRAEESLLALADEVEETVALCLHRGNTRVYAREIVSKHPLKYSRGVG